MEEGLLVFGRCHVYFMVLQEELRKNIEVHAASSPKGSLQVCTCLVEFENSF